MIWNKIEHCFGLKKMPKSNEYLEYLGEEIMDTFSEWTEVKYPIYVPSKGRSSVKLTTKALDDAELNYLVVIEPQDVDDYKKEYPSEKLLVMDKNDMGIAYVRNYCKQHSKDKFHWCIDDNIKDFKIRENDKNVTKPTRNVLGAAERYIKQFDNIGAVSLSHHMFAFAKNSHVSVNKQVYSCALINNDLDIWYRNDCVEDTDYSMQILTKGYCTILYNKLLMNKAATRQYKGGNTDSEYAGEGRLKRSQGLQNHWPGDFKVVKKKEEWRIAPSRVWDKFTQMPKGPHINLNKNTLQFE